MTTPVNPEDRTEIERLRQHVIALETELALYAATYGITDNARRLIMERPVVQLQTTGESFGAQTKL